MMHKNGVKLKILTPCAEFMCILSEGTSAQTLWHMGHTSPFSWMFEPPPPLGGAVALVPPPPNHIQGLTKAQLIPFWGLEIALPEKPMGMNRVVQDYTKYKKSTIYT